MSSILHRRSLHNARPFEGQGASLYVTSGTTPQYRRLRLQPRSRSVLRLGWSGRNPKTTRVAFLAGESGDTLEFAYDLSGLAAGSYVADVRHFRDDIENLTSQTRTHRFTIDASAAAVPQILGTARLIETEVRAGGVVRLTFRYQRVRSGLPPVTLKLIRTAGPSSPADVVVTYEPAEELYTFTTGALSDSAGYTFKLQAVNGATTADLLTGISVQADASGPAAPTLVSAAPQ